jgi:hypothetical protein
MNVIESWCREMLRLLTGQRSIGLPVELGHLDDRLLRDIGYEPRSALRVGGWDR